MSPTTMTRTSCPSTSPPASRAGGRSLFEPHRGGILAAGHSLSSQTGKPAGRAIGSQPRGPLETTAKTPQFPRNTQSEPSARRAVVGETLPRPGARRGRTTTATRSTTICGERGAGSMAADRLARGRTRSRPAPAGTQSPGDLGAGSRSMTAPGPARAVSPARRSRSRPARRRRGIGGTLLREALATAGTSRVLTSTAARW
jgi:hypothetical protein